jgi:predicted benzoate:H+ symporter BenE
MAILTTTLASIFTPNVGDFRIQCTGGGAALQSRPAADADWANEAVLSAGETKLVFNAIAGTSYRFVIGSPADPVSVRADQ